MRKIFLFVSVFICALCLAGCSKKSDSDDILTLKEINGLVTEKGYTENDCLEELSGRHEKEMAAAWGEPDGMLSGFWGDIWYLSDDKQIIVYYDKDGAVENIRIAER